MGIITDIFLTIRAIPEVFGFTVIITVFGFTIIIAASVIFLKFIISCLIEANKKEGRKAFSIMIERIKTGSKTKVGFKVLILGLILFFLIIIFFVAITIINPQKGPAPDTSIRSHLSQIRSNADQFWFSDEQRGSYEGLRDEIRAKNILEKLPDCSVEIQEKLGYQNPQEYQIEISEDGTAYLAWAPLCSHYENEEEIVFYCVDSDGYAEEVEPDPSDPENRADEFRCPEEKSEEELATEEEAEKDEGDIKDFLIKIDEIVKDDALSEEEKLNRLDKDLGLRSWKEKILENWDGIENVKFIEEEPEWIKKVDKIDGQKSDQGHIFRFAEDKSLIFQKHKEDLTDWKGDILIREDGEDYYIEEDVDIYGPGGFSYEVYSTNKNGYLLLKHGHFYEFLDTERRKVVATTFSDFSNFWIEGPYGKSKIEFNMDSCQEKSPGETVILNGVSINKTTAFNLDEPFELTCVDPDGIGSPYNPDPTIKEVNLSQDLSRIKFILQAGEREEEIEFRK